MPTKVATDSPIKRRHHKTKHATSTEPCFGTAWQRTNPSSAPRSCPTATNEKLVNLVSPHIESFNYLLSEGLHLAIADIARISIQLPGQSMLSIWVEDAQVGLPFSSNSIKGEQKLLPAECRQRGISYTAPLVLTLARAFNGSNSVERLQRIVGDIPIMVRSKRCHLHNLSPQQLVQAKEEANEMGGYFICNGNERCIRLLQMPRRHHMMAVRRGAFTNRGELYTDMAVFMKCVRRDQSSVTVTLHYLDDGSATVRFSVRKQEFMIPVGLVLKAMYSLTDREIYDRVLRGEHSNTFLALRMEVVIQQAKSFGVYTKEEALTYLGKHFRYVLQTSDNESHLQVGTSLIDEFIFVHLSKGEKGASQKAELLCLMLRKLYAFAKGDICEDNSDSIMNQELLLPGHLYLNILKEKIQEGLQSLRLQMLKECAKKTSVIDDAFVRRLWDRTPNIGQAMMYFLNTGNLKSSSGLDLMQVAGYTIVAEKLNFYRYLSHFRSVHRGQFFTEMKTTAVRKLLPDSWGFLCPVHTPDGSPCGLLNHLATECHVVCEPAFQATTILQNELKLSRFLASLGMIPSNGFSDGALIMPFSYLPVLFNGKIIGCAPCDLCVSIQRVLRCIKASNSQQERREECGIVANLEICLILLTPGGPFPGLYLSADAARLTRPVRQLDTQEVEWIGPMEQVFMDIACTDRDIRPATTHIEIKPTNMLSLVASLTPFSDYNQSPRNMYQCQMAKQTMGTPCHSLSHRSDSKMYRLQTPQSPIVQNERLCEYQLDEYPLGTNAVVAVISYTGYDMEDAMILNKSSYERGFAHASVYKHVTVDIGSDGKQQRTQKKDSSKTYFTNLVSDSDPASQMYSPELDWDGFPHVGKTVYQGDPLASWVDETTGKQSFQKHKESEPAVVEQVSLLGKSTQTCEFTKANLKLRFCRNPVIGDKFSSRHGQKGVLSILWPQTDMPFTESGMSPDIIINPHAFPSRMTIGMLLESMAAKAGALRGEYMDATPFKFDEKNRVVDYFGEKLKQFGYNYMGTEPLYSGISGTIMQADIYIGVVYYQRLRHMVSDKSQVRATGPMNSLTRQPVKGRKKGGGIRFGEMERDSLLAHGCSFLLQDRLMNCSDKHIAIVCTNCESLLSTSTQRANVETTGQTEIAIAMQTCRDHWYCRVCRTGEYCQPVAMPYVFRYLVNELAAMNIKLSLTLKSF
ncbi:hypothetical protein ABG067_000556 [Albugo candida]